MRLPQFNYLSNPWTIDHRPWTKELRIQTIVPAFGYITASTFYIKRAELDHAAAVVHRTGIYFAFIIRVFTIGGVTDG